MACCVVLTVLITVVRSAWFALTGTRPADVPFAPPARRPAPGEVLAQPAASASPVVQRRRDARQVGHQLVVVGLLWFAFGMVGMHLFGWFDWAHASVLADVVFHASGIWVATAGLAVIAFQRRTAHRRTPVGVPA